MRININNQVTSRAEGFEFVGAFALYGHPRHHLFWFVLMEIHDVPHRVYFLFGVRIELQLFIDELVLVLDFVYVRLFLFLFESDDDFDLPLSNLFLPYFVAQFYVLKMRGGLVLCFLGKREADTFFRFSFWLYSSGCFRLQFA